MSYSRWETKENSPWYAWGGGGAAGPLVLALWHKSEDHPVHITSAVAEDMIAGRITIQSRFKVVLTPLELQAATRILCEYLDDVAEEAGQR
jgi:hypothetical protein